MAYWAMAFLGSTAIGGPVIGWIGQNISARWSLGVGGAAAIIAAIIGYFAIKDIKEEITEEVTTNAEIAADEERRVM